MMGAAPEAGTQQLVQRHQISSHRHYNKFLDAPPISGGSLMKKIFRLAQVDYRSWLYTTEEPTSFKAIDMRCRTRHGRTGGRTDRQLAILSFARLWTAIAKQWNLHKYNKPSIHNVEHEVRGYKAGVTRGQMVHRKSHQTSNCHLI